MASINTLWYRGGLFSLRGKKITSISVEGKLSAGHTHIRPLYTHLSHKSEEDPEKTMEKLLRGEHSSEGIQGACDATFGS